MCNFTLVYLHSHLCSIWCAELHQSTFYYQIHSLYMCCGILWIISNMIAVAIKAECKVDLNSALCKFALNFTISFFLYVWIRKCHARNRSASTCQLVYFNPHRSTRSFLDNSNIGFFNVQEHKKAWRDITWHERARFHLGHRSSRLSVH